MLNYSNLTAAWLSLPWLSVLAYQSISLTSKLTLPIITHKILTILSELARFIAAGRLNCVIDKVNGVVLTNKIDKRTEQYQAVLKHGDQIINKMQKLGRIISY